MWKALPNALYNWGTIEYGQDWGSASPTTTMPIEIRDGCNPLVYTCFISGYEGTLARVLNSDLPSLDVSKWRYYTCPSLTNGSACPSSNSSNWTATFGDRTPVLPIWSWSHVYIKEFKTYLTVGQDGFFWSYNPEGPWNRIYVPYWVPGGGPGLVFGGALLGAGYEVVSTSPPHIKLTIGNATTGDGGGCCGSPKFYQFDIVLGRLPLTSQSEAPKIVVYGEQRGGYPTNHSGVTFSDANMPGISIPKRGLQWAFDFMDLFYVGYPNALNAIAGYYEITSGAAFLTPCHGPGLCNSWNSGQGATQSGFGPTISNNGYQAQMISMRNSQAQTVARGEASQYLDGHPGLTYENAPSAMAGNGT
jgi:hypothetical protein